MMHFVQGWTAGSPEEGNQSVFFGGFEADYGVVPGIVNPVLYRDFTSPIDAASAAVKVSIDFGLVNPLLSSVYTNRDTFGFSFMNSAGQSLAQVRFNPFTAVMSNGVNIEWLRNGTNVVPDRVSYLGADIGYNALYRLTASFEGGSFSASIHGLSPQGISTNSAGYVSGITDYAVTGSTWLVQNAALSEGMTAADFSRLALNWDLTSGAASSPGENYMLLNSVSVWGASSSSAKTAVVQIDPGSFAATYDGSSKTVRIATIPAGLPVHVTYNGLPAPPTDAGSYTVDVAIDHPDYEGNTSGTLVIGKATASVVLGNLARTYDGSAKVATATTTPSGLNVALTYDGSSNPPTNAGSYVVGALIDDPNYSGSASGTLVIGKATASVVLANLAQTYDGGVKSATATTTPSGLDVSFTYNGSALLPTNAGNYSVVATVDDPNYAGSASGTLAVAKANQTISFTGPGDLSFGVSPVALTGSATSGLSLGYSVVSGPGSITGTNLNVTGAGTIVLRAAQAGNGNYNAASAVDVIVAVAKAAATINLSNLDQTFNGSPCPVTVTTTPAGLSTTVLYNTSATVPSQVGQYTVGVTVNDPNYEGTSTGTLVIYYAESSLAVVNPNAVNEGRLVTVPIRLSSAGEVGGLTFRIQYDPTYLKAPEFKWLGRSALGLADVVVDEEEGIIDATVSLNGSTYQSGVADVAEVKLRTRSVPLSSVLTPVEVTINDASDANGTTLDNVLGALNGAITINRRTFVGDVNGNGFLDISDATGILRLLSGAEPGVAPTQTRPWDTALNDVNQNGSLTSGDVTALLSLISRRGTPPSLVTPRTLRTLSVSGFETSSAPLPEFNPQPVGNAIRAMSAAVTESARLSSRVYSAANGTVTVQLIVDNLTSPITGLSFQLNYPKDTLRLANVNAMQTGTLVPSSGVSRNWNLSTQAEFDAQTGEVRLAAASGTEWSNTSGIAATLVFNVLNDGGRDVFQTISVTDLAVSYLEQGGVELRNIAVSDAFYQRTIGEWATNNQVGSTTATDADKDGASDLAEYLAGTDPKSQVSRFSVREIRRPGGAVTRVQWATVKGVRYRVTTSTNLANWSPVSGSETDGTGTVTEVDISGSAEESKRFFRVEVAP